MKKFFNAILVMMISIFLISCGEKDNPPVVTPPDPDPPITTTNPEKDYKTFLDSINVASPNYEMVIEITDPEGKIIFTNKFDGKKVSSSTNLEEQPEPTYWETVNNKIYSYRSENSKWIREESSKIDIVNPLKEDYFKSTNFTYKDGKFLSTKESKELSIISVVIEVTDNCKGAIFDIVAYTSMEKSSDPNVEPTKIEGQIKITVKNNGTTSISLPAEYITENDLETFVNNIQSDGANYEMSINNNDEVKEISTTMDFTIYQKIDGNKVYQRTTLTWTRPTGITKTTTQEFFEILGDETYIYTVDDSIWTKGIDEKNLYVNFFDNDLFDADLYTFEDGKFVYSGTSNEKPFNYVIEVTNNGKSARLEITENDELFTVIVSNYGKTTVTLPTVS